MKTGFVFVKQRIELLGRNLAAFLACRGFEGFGGGEEIEFLGALDGGVGAIELIEPILPKVTDDRWTIRARGGGVGIAGWSRLRGVGPG